MARLDSNLEVNLLKMADKYNASRLGNLGHVSRGLDILKSAAFLPSEPSADPDVVIASWILHDSGYRRILREYGGFGPDKLSAIERRLLHMYYGSELAANTLPAFGLSAKQVQVCQLIILYHDLPEVMFEWGNVNGILVVEADRLDRYSVARAEEIVEGFDGGTKDYRWYARTFLNPKKDFVRPTVIELATDKHLDLIGALNDQDRL